VGLFSRASARSASIDAVLPFIGLNQVTLSSGRLYFGKAGMELDFGGLGKEYAADRAAEVCIGLGARYGFIDLGGDIRVIGPQPDGCPWRIGIPPFTRAGSDSCGDHAIAGRACDQRGL
jgi:thiamine biosynthesis lipoprotein